MIRTKENYIFKERYIWLKRLVYFLSLCVLIGVPLYYKDKMTINSYIGWVILFFVYYGFMYFQFLRKINKEKYILTNGLRDHLKIVEYSAKPNGRYLVYLPVFIKEDDSKLIYGVNEVPYIRKEIGSFKELIYFQNECVVLDNSSWKEVETY